MMRRVVLGLTLSLLGAVAVAASGLADPGASRPVALFAVTLIALPTGLLALPELERRLIARRRHRAR